MGVEDPGLVPRDGPGSAKWVIELQPTSVAEGGIGEFDDTAER